MGQSSNAVSIIQLVRAGGIRRLGLASTSVVFVAGDVLVDVSRMTKLQYLIAGLLMVVANNASAQQTIINVPSDALTPRGEHFVLHESQIVPLSSKGTFATTNFYTYGISDHVELAATLYGIDNNSSEFSTLGIGYKSVYEVLEPIAPELEVKWTTGFMLPISLNERNSNPSVGYFPYSHLSFEVPSTKLRLLGGVAAGSRNLFGEDAISVLAGAEYPLTKHLSFTGEWFSGDHNLSGLIPGFTYHRKSLIVVGGYKIPNDFRMEESGLVLEVGFFFGGNRSEEHETELPHYGVRMP